jgi:cytochrome c
MNYGYGTSRAAALLVACTLSAVAQAQVGAVVPPGKAQFGVCAACHPTSEDGAHSLGPNLRGVLGRRPGSVAGFRFSKAMAAYPAVWDKETLDAFLANPMVTVPNNAMPYAGMKSADDRKAVVEYLATLR